MIDTKSAETSVKKILDFIFPPNCIICSEIDHSSRYPFLCSRCISDFKPILTPLCTICGSPFFSSDTERHTCLACLNSKPRFDGSRSAGIYEGTLEKALKAFKYGRARQLAKPLADFILSRSESFIDEIHFDLVVPVPTGPRKLKERGFNQALLIARLISKKLGHHLNFENLYKSRETTPQVEFQINERRKNVQGSFAVRDSSVFENKSVLLIDDVFTTGSTLNECARVLKKEGKASEVYCLTAAKTVL
jgi:ComF family protein